MFIKLLLLVLLTSSCSSMRALSLNFLEKKADYDGVHKTHHAIQELKGPLLAPKRTGPKMADIWIHPHEMPTGDYFLGGWVRILVSQPQWKMK